MTGIEDEGDLQAQRLERMKNEFLVAQQRRRESAAGAASRRDDTRDQPTLAGPAADGLNGVTALKP